MINIVLGFVLHVAENLVSAVYARARTESVCLTGRDEKNGSHDKRVGVVVSMSAKASITPGVLSLAAVVREGIRLVWVKIVSA